MKHILKHKGITRAILCTIFTSTGQILWKIGSKNTGTLIDILTNIPLVAGFFFYGLGSLLLITALKYEDLSLVYPIIALSFVWVSTASIVLFHETITLINWIGIVAIIVGVSLIGYGSKSWT